MTESKLDILSIDSKIRSQFRKQREELSDYKDRLSELEKTLNNDGLSSRTYNDIQKNIQELRDTIQKIEIDEDHDFYIAETADYIQRYKKILKTPLKMSFMGKPKTDNKEKQQIICEYVKIAQKYYPINFEPPEKIERLSCDNCSNKEFIIEENSCICPNCGAQEEILQFTSSYKDIDRVNISSKYTYDRKVHFRDCVNQYQGKQNCTIDQKVYDDLEDAFRRHHLLVGDKNTKREIRFKKITKAHVLMFLKELRYPKHYENVILIHYNMTGKKPDDITHLEDKLMNDFDLLVETYDKYFKNNVERVNFISSQYVLYQLLHRHRHPCKKEDFDILKQVERKAFHDYVCKELFTRLGWNHTPLI